MIYQIEPALFQKYPNYVRGVIIAKRIVNIQNPIDEVARMLKSAQETIRDRADLERVAVQPNIAAWREAYRAFGAKPSEYPCSIEAMIKRVRRGDELPYINTLAALCNCASLRYITPIGGHALDDIPANGEVRLGFATGAEEFTPFGTTSIEHPEPGEVIYTFGKTVLCRRWTWRQAEFTKLEGKTTYAAINVDGLPPVSRADVDMICIDLANLISIYCGASVEIKRLSEETPRIEI